MSNVATTNKNDTPHRALAVACFVVPLALLLVSVWAHSSIKISTSTSGPLLYILLYAGLTGAILAIPCFSTGIYLLKRNHTPPAKRRNCRKRLRLITGVVMIVSAVILFFLMNFLVETYGTAQVDIPPGQGPCPVVGPGPCGEKPAIAWLAPRAALPQIMGTAIPAIAFLGIILLAVEACRAILAKNKHT